MTDDKVNEVLLHYVELLAGKGFAAKRLSPEERVQVAQGADGPTQAHLLWMALEAASWPTERLEKKFRWLGFIQGALWVMGIESIEDAKNRNKPADAAGEDGTA